MEKNLNSEQSPVNSHQLTVNSHQLQIVHHNFKSWESEVEGKNSIVYKKAYPFAVRIVKLFQLLTREKKEFILSKQLLRCGTSIGANVAEANGAISEADFSNKISLAYKECQETKFWLSLLKDTGFIDKKTFTIAHNEVDEIARIFFSILKTTRINIEK